MQRIIIITIIIIIISIITISTISQHCTQSQTSSICISPSKFVSLNRTFRRVSILLKIDRISVNRLPAFSWSRKHSRLPKCSRLLAHKQGDIKCPIHDTCADKTKYMVMFRDQNAGRIHSVRIDNSTFESVEEFKYLGTTLTNQNSIAEEIKSRLNSGNACYIRCRIFCLPGCYPKI